MGNWLNLDAMQGDPQGEELFQPHCMLFTWYYLNNSTLLNFPATLVQGKNEYNSFVKVSLTYFIITCIVDTSSRFVSLVGQWKQFYCR